MDKHRVDYMSLVGAFLWLANVTRPELSYVAGQLTPFPFVSNPGMTHYRAALRAVLLYLRGSESKLSNSLLTVVRAHSSLRTVHMLCRYDVDWSTRFSTSGGIFCYGGSPNAGSRVFLNPTLNSLSIYVL